MIKNYNERHGRSWTVENYHQGILNEMKENQIDILIVVKMFLTGFDSPLLNTLYLDRPLQKQELFQALSRTIRVYDRSKNFGQIYCFQTNKTEVDEALKLFAKSQNDINQESNLPDVDCVVTYESDKQKYEMSIQEVKQIAPNVDFINAHIFR
nr:type I restriction endonuclease subunit R [Candidatus Phytoplasma luffae]